jgi:thioredoxin
VDFHATWCGPCKMLGPLLEKFAMQYEGKIKFVKVDVDEAPQLAAQFNVRGVPTLALLNGENLVEEIVGLLPAPTLRAKFERLIESAETAKVEV